MRDVLQPERFCPCYIQLCRENWGRSCPEEGFARRICQQLQGCLLFSKHGVGCIILAHCEPKPCMDSVTVGWPVRQSWRVQEHCQAWGHRVFIPTSLPGSCLLCYPGSWQQTQPESQHSKFDSVQFWRAGEVFAGTSYERMRQLKSLSLRHYVLWGGGKNKSILKACRSFTKHLFKAIWPMWYTHCVIVAVHAGPCMMSVSLRCLWLAPCFPRSWSRLHTTGIQLSRLFPTLIQSPQPAIFYSQEKLLLSEPKHSSGWSLCM